MKDAGKICWVADLGLMAYAPACEWQKKVVRARQAGAAPDVLLFCEHPHAITLGRNGKREHLRVSGDLLAQKNVEFHTTDRGGDITYHGPGQVVGYPILDLAEHRRDVRWYVERLEETMIRATADFGVDARRSQAGHGAWVDAPGGRLADTAAGVSRGLRTPDRAPDRMPDPQATAPAQRALPEECPAGSAPGAGEEKLAALGVHLSRWVTSHGFAYNVSTDLRYFELIVPCGIAGGRATSLERVLGRGVRSEEVRARLAKRFGEVFERRMILLSRERLAERLADAPELEEVGAVKGLEG